jgi:methionine synthase II (cobalamin-independent)
MSDFGWPAGSATGVGSLPGTDPAEAVRLVFGELPDLPHLPELPARGPGADLIGRSAVFLVDLPVDLQPSGWRLVDRPGRDLRRARDLLARDLDALEEAADGYAGPLKLQAAGPWTLAAGIELHRGDKALADPGAARDLAGSLAEGLRQHLADVQKRVPGARILLQLDEPSLPAVLSGRVPTASGYGTLDAVEAPTAEAGLRTALTAGGDLRVVHCCAAQPPVELFHAAGARAVSLDVTQLTDRDDEALGTAIEAGVALWLGLVPGTDATLPPLAATVQPARRLWSRLGQHAERLAQQVVVTPACGLAGASPGYARAALRRVREAGRALRDDPEG